MAVGKYVIGVGTETTLSNVSGIQRGLETDGEYGTGNWHEPTRQHSPLNNAKIPSLVPKDNLFDLCSPNPVIS